MNKDKKQNNMSFIEQLNDHRTTIKDTIEDKLSFIEGATWTLTWRKCPNSPSCLYFANLAKYAYSYIHANLDIVHRYNSPRTFLRTLCPSEMKPNTWTNAWTKCPCSKY